MKRIIVFISTVLFCFSLMSVHASAATYEQHTIRITAEDFYNQFGSKGEYYPEVGVFHNTSGSYLFLKIELGDISKWVSNQVFVHGNNYTDDYVNNVYFAPKASNSNRIGLPYYVWTELDFSGFNNVAYYRLPNNHYIKEIVINYTTEFVKPLPSVGDIGYVTGLLSNISSGLWEAFQANWISRVIFIMPVIFGIVMLVVTILKKTTDFDAKLIILKGFKDKYIFNKTKKLNILSFVPPKIKDKLLRRRYTVVNIDGAQYVRKISFKERRKTK